MTKDELIGEIIDELLAISRGAPPVENSLWNMPPSIALEDGHSLLINDRVELLLGNYQRILVQNDAGIARSYSQKEFGKVVAMAFGAVLATIDLDDDRTENIKVVKTAVSQSLTETTAHLPQARDLVFGCHLFADPVAAIEMGPVRIEDRSEWLGRMTVTGAFSAVAGRRIARRWSGLPIGRRKGSADSMWERTALDIIGKCGAVCTVSVRSMSPRMAEARASTAARMSLAAIGLLWQQPSSVLRGIGLAYDHGREHHRETIVIIDGKFGASNHTLARLPHGPTIEVGKWKDFYERDTWFFEVIGELFAEYLHVASSSRPRMMSALFHSLWWFQQACVEHSPLLAAIKHAAAIEALAGGREKQGIMELLTARLSLDRKRQAFKDGTTLDQFIEQLYGVARSQTLHGTNVRHAEDWSQLQVRSEQMARLALRSVTHWLSKHPNTDELAALRSTANP
ncbi:hypothetical protein [Nitratireductor soli]|uniref:hypothetical protein n=1 Tax=Nitratireductor soli TaxID=1670619 RepID=UPI00065E97CC|nr:hypothetical protein [Nitratireductor soli]